MKQVFIPEEKRKKDVRLIDAEDISQNIYHVTGEFSFTNGSKTIRQDVVFLINGIPVLFIETKSANKKEGIEEAIDQIKRYHTECPELLAINQVYALTHILKYYYSSTWNTSAKHLFNWKEEVQGNFETLVKKFLNRERIVKLITDYILFTRKDDELTKVVLRPHQIRAVQKIVVRAEDRREFSRKTAKLVQEHTASGKIQSSLEILALATPTTQIKRSRK
ncbi:MAG: type I restriction endonuclease subunit R [Spirochaetales bacterium]|nr:type I restriction endonuclease subunit R [Spirochaetales bacterium]